VRSLLDVDASWTAGVNHYACRHEAGTEAAAATDPAEAAEKEAPNVRAFIMSPEIESSLRKLMALAESPERRIPLATIKAYAQGSNPSWKGSPVPLDQFVDLPLGWRVALSVEEHPTGWYRHLSMSSPDPGRAPSPAAVEMVLVAVGFARKLEECHIHLEQFAENRVAVNVIEPL
jgi:hypothetical protein